MTLNYPESEPRSFAPVDPARTSLRDEPRLHAKEHGELAAEETIVPVYARKPARKKTGGVDKRILMAAPVALATIAIGAWAFTAGDSGREAGEAPLEVAASDMAPTRLASDETLSPEPLAVSETTLAPATPTPAVTPPARAATPAPTPRAAATPAPRRAPAARRTASASAPAAAAAASSSEAATPITPVPYEANTVAPVVTSTTPAPAPATVAPTPVLPAEPDVIVVPSTTATPPDGGLS